MVCGGVETTHSYWHEEEEDVEKRRWTSGIYLKEGTGTQD